MKKTTITSLALLMSAHSAHALIGPRGGGDFQAPRQPKQEQHYCLGTYEQEDGSLYAGSCDESRSNKLYGLKLNKNGCADQQVAVVTTEFEIRTCPTVVQL